jgi:hypothetical protein
VNEPTQFAAHVRSIAHSLIPVSNNCLCDQSSEVVVILPANTFHGNGDVGGRDGIVTNSDLRADKIRLSLLSSGNRRGRARVWLSSKTREVLLSKLNELSVRNTSSTNKNHTIGCVVCLDVVDQIVSLYALDVLSRAQNRPSQWLSLESCCVQVIEHNFLQLLIHLLRFSQDNITLSLNSLGLELGVLKDIREDVDGSGYICVEGFGIVYGVLTLQTMLAFSNPFRLIQTYRCVGIQMTTHVLDFKLQLLLCPVAGTLDAPSILISTPCEPIESYLEGKMFQEVSCAIGLVRFRARPSINPHPNS